MVAEFRFPPQEVSEESEALRREVRDFIAEELAAGYWEPQADSWLSGFDPAFSRRLAQKGWIGLTWPKKYGGHERSALDRFVVTEELLAAGAPVSAHWIADRQSGPLLLRYGTEEQRQKILPRVAAGECFFAIGMSEPDSGSDLASIRTNARRTDSGWVMNGQKVWTSHAHDSHYMIVLARTEGSSDDRHAGMSQFLVPTDAKGVTIRPIRLLTGAHHFNEVIFDNAELPADAVVGEPGNGWKQVMAELAYERSGPERFLSTFPLFVELLRTMGDSPDDRLAGGLGQIVAKVWTLHQMSQAVANLLNQGIAPELEAALVKDLGTRFERDSADFVRHLAGTESSLTSPTRLNVLLAESVLHAPGFTLRGGATEVLRGIVARGLGVR